ncbi:conjugal transfer protein TraG N-terminal domain-containing protein [Vibrio sonorensis]|uniref:conjugal transfer protein TraG N-terminal domain-containing protein n=1 Tax=Vibrio sonorensis TaxID=1004316 RepID=UPI0009FBBC81
MRGDIEINAKYTWKDIYDSSDIFAFLDAQSMSALRGVLLPNGSFKTCNTVYPDIKAAFSSDALNHINKLGSYLYANNAARKMGFLQSSIENAYSTYGSISTNSNQIFLQNMAINAVRNSVHDMGNTTGLAMNYAYTSNKIQTTSMWMSVGLQAKEFVPMIHTIFFLMFSCFSFVVVLVALIPNMTLSVLGNYFKTFGNLALHPFVFAILNSIMNWSLEARSSGFTDDFGGFTLSNANAVDEIHTRFAAIAGYLMMSTPLIAAGILKGGGAIFGSLYYGFAGMVNGVAERTSTAVATGDISQGNTSINNHSFNNTSANKHDTSGLQKHHSNVVQQQDGGFITTFSNGATQFDNTGTVTNAHYTLAETESINKALRNEFAETNQSLQAQSKQISNGNSFSDTSLQTYGVQHSDTSQYSSRDAISTSNNLNDNVNQMQSSLNNVSQMTGWSNSDSIGLMTSLGAQMKAGASVPSNKILDAGVGINAGISKENAERWEKLDSEQRQAIWQEAINYNSSASKVLDIANSKEANDLNADTRSWLANWSNNFTETDNAMKSSIATHQRSSALTDAITLMDQQGINVSENLMPMFQHYVENRIEQVNRNATREQVAQHAYSIMTDKSSEGSRNRDQLLEQYIDSDTFVKDLSMRNVSMQNHSDLNQTHAVRSSDLTYQQWQDISAEHQNNKTKYTFATWGDDNKFDTHTLYDGTQQDNIRGQAEENRERINSRFQQTQPTSPTPSPVQAEVEGKMNESFLKIGGEKDDWRARLEEQNGRVMPR